MRPRPVKYLLVQAVCGALIGAAVAAVLAANVIPDFTQLPVTLDIAEGLRRVERLGRLAAWWAGWRGGLVLAAALLSSWVLIARRLNPSLPPFPFSTAPKPALAWTALLLSAGALAGGLLAATWAAETVGETPDFLIAAGKFDATAACLAAAGGALAWLILSPAGWAGDLGAWRWPWKAAERSWLRTAAFGAAFGAALWASWQFADRAFQFLFELNIGVWHPGLVLRYDAARVNLSLPVVACVFFFVAVAALADALAADEKSVGERLRRAAPALAIGLAAGAALLALRRDAVAAHDWDAPDLAAAAALPDRSAPAETLVALTFDGSPRVAVKAWDTEVKYWGYNVSGKVPATAADAAALLRFLSGRGRASRYRSAAQEGLSNIDSSLWEPGKSGRDLEALGSGYGWSALDAMNERAWLASAAPITPENRARLEALSDAKTYQIGSRMAASLARAWRRFGDLPRAREWREAARAKGARPDELANAEIPDAPPLAGGAVKGRVRLKGAAAVPIEVGLFAISDWEKKPSAPGLWTVRVFLAGSAAARSDGSFAFDHLGAGRYLLAFLVPAGALPADAKNVRASRHPGIIALDRAHPRLDAGEIVLSRP